jgi:hypothetical protein
MRRLADDLRCAVRLLRGSSGFTAGETLTLMLGIGATTAIVVSPQRVLMTPSPVHKPDTTCGGCLRNLACRLCKLTSVEMKR